MQGAWLDPEKRGVIPNAFDHIFTHISRSQSDKQYLVRASYLEIYLEEVRDLLDPNHGNARALELRENPESGVYVRDLTSCVCKSIKEIEEVMNVGNQARAVGATDMNEHSSRSHALFLITVECSQPGPDGRKHIRVGRLNLVDLAGSERQAKTGVQGERLKEAAKINLSLSALGNVISALADGRSGHVPYRDSKLTRLLQDSLGGNAKTVMVATLGPAHQHYDETLTTLRYANRAKNIQNQPRVNEDPKDALLREFQREIARLRAQLNHRKWRSKQKKEQVDGEAWERDGDEETDAEEEVGVEKDAEEYVKLEEQRLESEKEAIRGDQFMLAEEKQRLLGEKERMMGDLRKEQEATEQLTAKYKSAVQPNHMMGNVGKEKIINQGYSYNLLWAMESKLLVGGKNIIDHTNEQQKMLEMKRNEIAEQSRKEREMQQQMLAQDEETLELRETFTSLQQEVEAKTKKLKKLYAKLQCIKAEIQDVNDEHVRSRQELEQTQNELTRELKFKYLIIENFIPPEEKNKIMNRLTFDPEEDQWKFQPLVPAESLTIDLAENIMFLELDMTPPNSASLDRSAEAEPNQSHSLDNSPTKDRGVRKSRSW
ncbi:hypothetical protein L3Q82_010938 [Scortum barcoo]|uniref:Uncharacterized protein n=1 Tax=Scortum barcoo TaxID=214431 RepID=A0ACB8W8P7_9TELE|nr:hypothetical protein L3Q82_010938 [Scortum barcoo]